MYCKFCPITCQYIKHQNIRRLSIYIPLFPRKKELNILPDIIKPITLDNFPFLNKQAYSKLPDLVAAFKEKDAKSGFNRFGWPSF